VHAVYQILAYAYEWNGDLDRAQEARRRAIEQGRQLNNPWIVTTSLLGLIGTALEAGRIGEARQLLPQFGSPKAGAHTPVERGRMIAWVVCSLEEGDIEAARRWLTVSLSDATTCPGNMPRARLLAIHAHLALLDGDDEGLEGILPALLACFGQKDNYMDHPALIAGLALERLQGLDAAARFVGDFVQRLRPERWMPREELRRLAEGSAPLPLSAR